MPDNYKEELDTYTIPRTLWKAEHCLEEPLSYGTH